MWVCWVWQMNWTPAMADLDGGVVLEVDEVGWALRQNRCCYCYVLHLDDACEYVHDARALAEHGQV